MRPSQGKLLGRSLDIFSARCCSATGPDVDKGFVVRQSPSSPQTLPSAWGVNLQHHVGCVAHQVLGCGPVLPRLLLEVRHEIPHPARIGRRQGT
eukprot:5447025-Alexandrium_andersonii.AAC.1